MTRYQRKPGPLNAVQISEQGTLSSIDNWVLKALEDRRIQHYGFGEFYVVCGERHSAVAYIGDWILQRPDGTMAVVSNASFRAVYVEIEEEDP